MNKWEYLVIATNPFNKLKGTEDDLNSLGMSLRASKTRAAYSSKRRLRVAASIAMLPRLRSNMGRSIAAAGPTL